MSRKTFLHEVDQQVGQVLDDLDKPLGPRDMSMDARVVIAALWTNMQWVLNIPAPERMTPRFTVAVNELVAAGLAEVEKTDMSGWNLRASQRLLRYPTHERRMDSQQLLDNAYECLVEEKEHKE